MPKPIWTGKSPWNLAMDKLRITLREQYDITTVTGDKDVQILFEAIVDIYQLKNAAVGNVQSTENLTRMMTQSFDLFSMSKSHRRDLKINISHVARDYELEHDLGIKQAPVIPIPKLMELAWSNFSDTD